MKIAVFGKFRHRTRTTGFIIDAFQRAGHETRWFNRFRWRRFIGEKRTGRLLLGRALRFAPDLVFAMTTDCPTEVLGELAKTCTVAVFSDRYDEEPDPALVERGKASSVFFMAVDGLRQMYMDAGVPNVVYLPQGCDAIAHRPVSDAGARYRSDVAFIGKPRPYRTELLKKVAERFGLKVWGPGWKGSGFPLGRTNVTPRHYASVCAGTAILLGADIAPGVRLCYSNRTYITLGCGGFLLTSYVNGLEDVFENRKHLAWYRSDEECVELIDYYMKRPHERMAIADEGSRYVHDNYTYDHFVKRVLDAVSGLES